MLSYPVTRRVFTLQCSSLVMVIVLHIVLAGNNDSSRAINVSLHKFGHKDGAGQYWYSERCDGRQDVRG